MKYLVPMMLLFGVVLSFFQIVAIDRSWYYTYWWFDIPMHILGGAVIAFVILYGYKVLSPEEKGKQLTFFVLVFSVFFVGVVWEIYEYVIDLMYTHLGWDAIDTGKDLIDDVIGASIVARFLIKK